MALCTAPADHTSYDDEGALAADEIGQIAGNAPIHILIVDDVPLPPYRRLAHLHHFEQVTVFPFSGAPVAAEFLDLDCRRAIVRAAIGRRGGQTRAEYGDGSARRGCSAARTAPAGAWLCQMALPEQYEVIDAVPRSSNGNFWKVRLAERCPC